VVAGAILTTVKQYGSSKATLQSSRLLEFGPTTRISKMGYLTVDHLIIGMALVGFASVIYLFVQTGRILDDTFFEDK
jgi:hypothetical protein